MSTERRQKRNHALNVSVGWVFADLLLAVAMLFLIANTPGAPQSLAVPTPTPTPTPIPTPIPTPSPTPIPRSVLILDTTKYRLQVTVNDTNALLQNSQGEEDNLAQAIRQEIVNQHLQGRRAGIAIVYGGAAGPNDIRNAQNIANQVYKVLDMLGTEHFVFCKTVHYDPLFVLGNANNIVSIDVYLFDQSAGDCNSIQ